MLPGRPDDASQAIGERDGGFVVASLAFAVERPTAQAVEGFARALRAVRGQQRRARPVDNQGSQVHVALLGDSAESASLGAGSLTGGEAEPGGEVSTGRKAVDITDGRSDGSAGEQTDAGYLAQLPNALVRACESGEL